MKKFNLKSSFLIWLLLVPMLAMGARVGDNTLKIGVATGSDIQINMGGGSIKFNDTTSKMQTSNDGGSTFKDIGSGTGGGGGQNFFENGDAESGTANWNNIGGGTFVTNAVTPINGLNDFAWNASAQNDIVRTDQISIPEKFKGQACQIEFVYSGGTNDLVKPQVVDSSNVKLPGATFRNQVDGSDFLQAQTNIVQRSIFFICPTSGTIKFEYNQTVAGNPALMNYDDVHVGDNLGLAQAVLPDVLSANFDGDGTCAVLSESVNFVSSCSRTGAGSYEVNFVSGMLTIVPGVVMTGNTADFMSIVSVSTSQLVLSKTSDAGVLEDGDFSIVVIKQGVDAQQSVLVFTSIPKVAENINDFSALVADGAGTTTVSRENTDWITGNCTNGSAGAYVCTLSAFISTPNCQVQTISGADRTAVISSLTNTSMTVNTYISNTGVLTDATFMLSCQKGDDFKLPTVPIILVNQVETSLPNGVRVESCQIDNTGTPVTANSLCNNWISSVSDGGVGLAAPQFVTGIFSEAPVCTMSTDDTFTIGFTAPTTVGVSTAVRATLTGTLTDTFFFMTCIGKR